VGNFRALASNPVGDIDPAKMQGFLGYDFLWAPAIGMKP
jgi:hypothetical protein